MTAPVVQPIPRLASALARPPVVLLPACHREVERLPFQIVSRKYVEAVRLAGAVPLVVPAAPVDELGALLDVADGVLLTGSPSNVHPSHFGEAVHDPSLPLDPDRDAWTLPLIREALARGIPLMGICRGFQEVNVALGGSLHQAVHEQPGLMDHRSDENLPVDEEWGLAHPVTPTPGGLLAQLLAGLPPEVLDAGRGCGGVMVNSLHGQGVRDLAPGLRVEARAPDGVVEAFTSPEAPGFNLCVQWHPEWRAEHNPVSRRLFEAFGQACVAYRRARHHPSEAGAWVSGWPSSG